MHRRAVVLDQVEQHEGVELPRRYGKLEGRKVADTDGHRHRVGVRVVHQHGIAGADPSTSMASTRCRRASAAGSDMGAVFGFVGFATATVAILATVAAAFPG